MKERFRKGKKGLGGGAMDKEKNTNAEPSSLEPVPTTNFCSGCSVAHAELGTVKGERGARVVGVKKIKTMSVDRTRMPG